MTIELIYCPIPGKEYKDEIIRKTVRLKKNAKIEEILSLYSAKGLAEWQEDKYGGIVIGDYKSTGPLSNECKYFILSGNIKKTINRMKELRD